jgi:hypothetical protein
MIQTFELKAAIHKTLCCLSGTKLWKRDCCLSGPKPLKVKIDIIPSQRNSTLPIVSTIIKTQEHTAEPGITTKPSFPLRNQKFSSNVSANNEKTAQIRNLWIREAMKIEIVSGANKIKTWSASEAEPARESPSRRERERQREYSKKANEHIVKKYIISLS